MQVFNLSRKPVASPKIFTKTCFALAAYNMSVKKIIVEVDALTYRVKQKKLGIGPMLRKEPNNISAIVA